MGVRDLEFDDTAIGVVNEAARVPYLQHRFSLTNLGIRGVLRVGEMATT